MAKTRFSVSMDADLAERVKKTAERRGEDVSSYLSRAASQAVEHDERVTELFAGIDALNAETEPAADLLPWPPPPADGKLSDAERQAVVAWWDAFFGDTEDGAA
jgi:predicted transcriptional regulator